MASSSAIVMPLQRCCIAKIQRAVPECDVEGEILWCRGCGTFLTFDKGAWKAHPESNNSEWYEAQFEEE